jgi:hypothetical protein
MKKERIEISGKRYLIYYNFNNNNKQEKPVKKGEEKK